MFSFPWRRTCQQAEQERPEEASHTVVLEPARIVLAVGYHLLDERIALAVDAGSRDAAVGALTARGIRLTIVKERWETMRNSERLHWLVARTPIHITLDPDRIATLRVSTTRSHASAASGYSGSELSR